MVRTNKPVRQPRGSPKRYAKSHLTSLRRPCWAFENNCSNRIFFSSPLHYNRNLPDADGCHCHRREDAPANDGAASDPRFYLAVGTTSVLGAVIRRGNATRKTATDCIKRVLHNHLAPNSRLQVSAVVSLQMSTCTEWWTRPSRDRHKHMSQKL